MTRTLIRPTERRGSRRALIASSVALVFSLGAESESGARERESHQGQPGARLAGVVGQWADTSDGGIVVNGEKWSGTTDVAALRRWSDGAFGSTDTALVAAWTSQTAFPIAVAPQVRDFASGTLRVQFNMLGGASDQIAGIMLGLRPNGEYFYVRYNTRDGNVALWRFVKGQREVISHGEVHKQIPLRAWHELVVTIRGAEVSARITGDTTISVSHTLPSAPNGRVGVWVKRDAITAFKAFRAEPAG
jgi:hypothetical protein